MTGRPNEERERRVTPPATCCQARVEMLCRRAWARSVGQRRDSSPATDVMGAADGSGQRSELLENCSEISF